MAKLTLSGLVLNIEAATRVLEEYRYVYVGVNQQSHDLVLTPTNKHTTIQIAGLEDKPSEIIMCDMRSTFIINIPGLYEVLGGREVEYTAEHVAPEVSNNGVVISEHIVLTKKQVGYRQEVEPQKEESFTSLDNLRAHLGRMSLVQLKDMAISLGVTLIKKDWRKTICSKIETHYKRKHKLK